MPTAAVAASVNRRARARFPHGLSTSFMIGGSVEDGRDRVHEICRIPIAFGAVQGNLRKRWLLRKQRRAEPKHRTDPDPPIPTVEEAVGGGDAEDEAEGRRPQRRRYRPPSPWGRRR